MVLEKKLPHSTDNKRTTVEDLRRILGSGKQSSGQSSGRAIHDPAEVGKMREEPSIVSSDSSERPKNTTPERKPPKKVSFTPVRPTVPKATPGPSTAPPPKPVNRVNKANHIDNNLYEGPQLEDHIHREFKLKLGDNTVTMARRITSHHWYKDHPTVLLWDSSEPGDDDQIALIKSIISEHFVTPVAPYPASTGLVMAYEFLNVSLVEVAMCRDFEEPELVCILKQVISGLEYLEQHGIGHPKLSCSNVLMSITGKVKICGQHHCRRGTTNNLITGLYRITGGLLTGLDEKGIEYNIDFSRWGDPHLPEFFDMMGKLGDNTSDTSTKLTTGAKLEKIRQHELMGKYKDHDPPMDALVVRVLYFTRWLVKDI